MGDGQAWNWSLWETHFRDFTPVLDFIHAIQYAYAEAWEPDDAARHFRNNAARMDYPRYRREGLPITSSPMESLIKQINQRVKGTEMFWNDPAGAEAILRIRAASLCDDGRLANYLARSRGCAFTRRPTPFPLAQTAWADVDPVWPGKSLLRRVPREKGNG